jgi:hypothetical protein
MLKKLVFKINEPAPHEISMMRLLEYLTELATMLGNRNDVHFLKVQEGSTEAVMEVREEVVPEVESRVQEIVRGDGPIEGRQAFRNFSSLLAKDGFTAGLLTEQGNTITEFLRPREENRVYGPFEQHGSLDGILLKVGGKDATVPVQVLVDGKIEYCNTDIETARKMGRLLQKPIRVYGDATWLRIKAGKWELDGFYIDTFEELDSASLLDVVERLRAIPNNDLNSLEDPLGEMRKIRHGE